MEARRATLANMGLRSDASVAFHILQENVWESNLVSDIAKVDYLAGHKGQTNLHPPTSPSSIASDLLQSLFCGGLHLAGFRGTCLSASSQAVQSLSAIAICACSSCKSSGSGVSKIEREFHRICTSSFQKLFVSWNATHRLCSLLGNQKSLLCWLSHSSTKAFCWFSTIRSSPFVAQTQT